MLAIHGCSAGGRCVGMSVTLSAASITEQCSGIKMEPMSSMIPLELCDILTCAAMADYEYRCKA